MTIKIFMAFRNVLFKPAFLAISCCLLIVTAGYADIRIVFSPAHGTVEYDETFDVEVRVEDVTDLHAVKTVFSYDPGVLEIVSVTEGNFLSGAGSAWFSTTPSPASDAAGSIQADQATYGSATASCAGSYGVLYTVRFHAIDYGISSLNFTSTSLRDGSNDEITHTSEDGSVTVNEVIAKIKIWLEGPYQAGGAMTTTLNTNGYLPLSSPYTEAPRTVSSIPLDVTDWILVELRSSASGTEVSRQSFFLKSDGTVVDTDGSTIDLPLGGVPDGDYYILVRHRNHLSVMSAAAQSLGSSSPSLYDFTAGGDQFYKTSGVSSDVAKEVETGVWGMYAGDYNQDGNITVADNNGIMLNRYSSGYETGDINLDTNVTVSDNNNCMKCRYKSTQIPNG